MGNRLDLQVSLESILGSRNVYFQPPTSLVMKYPCIVYELDRTNRSFADNKSYIKHRVYTVTLIHKDPDNNLIDAIEDGFEYISLDRTFIVDNLHHYVFTLFY